MLWPLPPLKRPISESAYVALLLWGRSPLAAFEIGVGHAEFRQWITIREDTPVFKCDGFY